MGFWSKHRRTILIATGVLGCGYGLYRFYSWQKQRTLKLDNDLFGYKQDSSKIITDALQTHFENIQRISETITLPHAMRNLRSRIKEDFDLSQLFEKLMQGKAQGQRPNKALRMNEKLEIWDRLKILSFMKIAASVWAMVVIFLYVRVQVNILGRQLYIETAQGFLASEEQDESSGAFNRHAQKVFLETSDFFTRFGFSSLISQMEMATTQVLTNTKLTESFNPTHLSQTVMEILGLFMNDGKSDSWVNCILPLNAAAYQNTPGMSSNMLNDPNIPMDSTMLDQLISEARTVLLSIEFRNIVEITTRIVVDGLMEDLSMELNGTTTCSDKHPLVKLLPRVAMLSNAVIEEVGDNKYIRTICGLPDVELFFTLLYTDIPQQPVSFSESVEASTSSTSNEDRKSIIIDTQKRKFV